MSNLQLFTDDLLDDLLRQAGAAVRVRANYNVHATPHDAVQRLFMAAQRSSISGCYVNRTDCFRA